MGATIVTILYIAALLTVVLNIILLLQRKPFLAQRYMLMSFACSFLCILSSILRINAKDLGGVVIAARLLYLSSGPFSVIFLFYSYEQMKRRIPVWIACLSCGELVVTFLLSTLLFDLGLYSRITVFQLANGIATATIKYTHYAYFAAAIRSFVMIYAAIQFTIAELGGDRKNSEAGANKPPRKSITGIGTNQGSATIAYVFGLLFIVASFTQLLVPWIYFEPMAILLTLLSLCNLAAVKLFNEENKDFTTRGQLVESTPESFIILDENFHVTDMNEAAKKNFPDIVDSIGHSLPDQYSFLLENYDQPINFTHGSLHFERRFNPIMNGDMVMGYGLCLYDVTKAHQMMLEMRELKRNSDIANEAKSSFLANMSHEVRTPMNAIVGYVELLTNENLSKEGRAYADEIRSSASSLLHIINDILDFSKIEQGKLEIIEEEYETEALFSEVANIIHMQTEKKGLRFVNSVNTNMPAVLFGDKVRIKQVLLNIAGNAVKFTEKGTVRINVEWKPENDGFAGIHITVSDTGIGIAAENMSRLFNEFEQVDIRSTMTKPGTGMGLVISKSLIEMMDGTINIASEYGVGTSVSIYLRQKIVNDISIKEYGKTATAQKNDSKISSFVAPDARILVVDDNKVNLELMVNYLKQFRIVPDLAEGGAKAVSLVSQNKYDIVFMDQMMPEMDGVEAMKRIRALGNSYVGKLPIVALTANAIAGTRNKLIGEGFTDYASKPLPLKTLEYLLMKYLPKGSYNINADKLVTGDTSGMGGVIQREKKMLELPDYINQEIGITNAGSDIDQFRSVVGIVSKYAEEKLGVIEEKLKNADYPAFTIEVHAMKSNAATVGAMALSEKARMLEMAGKSGDYDMIVSEAPGFIEEYRVFAEDLKKCIEHEERMARRLEGGADTSEKAQMSAQDEEYMTTFAEIGKAVRDGRYDAARDLLGVLEFFNLPPVTAHAVGSMREAAKAQNWQTILDIIEKMR